jgi:hypothetical protein
MASSGFSRTCPPAPHRPARTLEQKASAFHLVLSQMHRFEELNQDQPEEEKKTPLRLRTSGGPSSLLNAPRANRLNRLNRNHMLNPMLNPMLHPVRRRLVFEDDIALPAPSMLPMPPAPSQN